MFSARSDTSESTNITSVKSLLARRTVKRPRDEETQLQESCVRLFTRHQRTSDLLLEITSHEKKMRNISCVSYEHLDIHSSALEEELRRRSEQMKVSVELVSVRLVCEKLEELSMSPDGVLLNSTQRADVCALLKCAQKLRSAGLFSPHLLWQEYWTRQPILEVMYHFHTHNILTLEFLLERDAGVSSWISDQLQSLCVSMTTMTTPDDREIHQHILSTVVCVLVRTAFEDCSQNLSKTCCSVLDLMISWLLDSVSEKASDQSSAPGVWVQVYDATVFGVCVSEDMLLRFFTHTLMRVLTHRPAFKVSDAVALQSEWTFAQTPQLLTALFCKICLVFSVESVLCQLQQVLETHEVNWRHVLSCLSNLLIYHPQTQTRLKDLLSKCLRSAFDTYDVERMITSFLLARQASLEGPAVFPSYSDWFKLSFGGASGYHGNSKKSTVFLLKFLSDLVPFEPPQYLKVHVMHPPYIRSKHRSLLQEYISLTKTRLADLKVSLEETGIFEVVNGSAGVLHCPAQQDVEKAVTLFTTNNRIPATVIEASIFRRPYFLSRFLPALLSPRVLPVKADPRMNFIEALRKAEKIPALLYSSYMESCQRESCRQQQGVCESVEGEEDHLMILQEQFLLLRKMMSDGASDGDVSAQLSKISLSLRSMCSDEETGSDVICLNLQSPDQTHAAIVNIILQNFCMCLLEASKVNPVSRQGEWASVFMKVLLGHRRLISPLIHRLWDLLHKHGVSLSQDHVLGLAALLVELHHMCPQVQIMNSTLSLSDHLSDALLCYTRSHMAFCLRFSLAVLSYGFCKANCLSEELHNFIPARLFKKVLFLMARLLPETRALINEEHECDIKTDVSELTERLKDSAIALWSQTQIKDLKKRPQYQLLFSEWLTAELRVQRSQDALTDTERLEYEHWVCEQYYLPMPVCEGGNGGDVTRTCADLITAVLDQHSLSQTSERSSEHTDSCLPDLLSLLQVLMYQVTITVDESHFLWDLLEDRCTVTSDLFSIGHDLEYQQIVENVSRVLVLVPALLLLPVRTDLTGRKSLDCHRLIKHINDVQRRSCDPAALLSLKLTTHFLKAVVCASVSCDDPAVAVNDCLLKFSVECPLMLLSAQHWWMRVSAVLRCQWRRLAACDVLPEQLQMLDDCHNWSRRPSVSAGTSAPAWLKAACLHRFLKSSEMEKITQETDRQILNFLFVFSVIELISEQLHGQGSDCWTRVRDKSISLVTHLLEDSDWLLLFDQSGSDASLCHFTCRVLSPQMLRLMPMAFYSIVTAVDSEVLHRMLRSSAFIHTAAVNYRELNKLFLDSDKRLSSVSQHQVLLDARQVLMNIISLSSADSLTLGQRRQLQSDYEQMDGEISAALNISSRDTHSF
ncbi:Fanconi anemia group A protein [Triplophysa tibetana]|uniref:Fanconi anemia group A protein n=1 Tax=Triplophysa tibetana TaxID=1572043 RepID=A0A5A9PQM5_9TELE|nr:Fanconi anemia group A protein [Triplophysa tibetana]